MTISVLMTVYNGERYLKQSLESVLAQTCKDFEFLIINDASTDRSLDIIQSYKDLRIKVFTNPRNMGQTASLNIGLRMARGQYVARMDADDRASLRWLEALSIFIKKNPDVIVVSPKAAVINEQGETVRVLNTYQNRNDICLKSVFSSPINHVGCLMDRERILSFGGYDEQYRIVADYALWSKLLRHNQNIRVMDDVLVAVRLHDDSISMKEASKQVVLEIERIIGENILFWSQVLYSSQNVGLLRMFVYESDQIAIDQYICARNLFKQVYLEWKHPEGVPLDQRRVFIQREFKRLTLRRVWLLFKRRDFAGIRESLKLSFRRDGIDFIFVLIWFCTFFGGLLECLSRMYDFFNQTRAKLRMPTK